MAARYRRETLLKDIRPHHLKPLIDMLDLREKYKILASKLVKKRGRAKMYTPVEIDGLEIEFLRQGSPAKSVLDRWRFDNPTLYDVATTLETSKLIREAEYVISKLLKEKFHRRSFASSDEDSDNSDTICCHQAISMPTRGPEENDEDEISISKLPTMLNAYSATNSEVIDSNYSTYETTSHPAYRTVEFQIYPYETLQQWTDNFNDKPIEEGGRLIGTGGFAHVYLGKVDDFVMAVKRMAVNPTDSDVFEAQGRQFEVEVATLAGFSHKNLLKIFGQCVAEDWTFLCIVSEYMVNGSLEDKLSCKKEHSDPLTFCQRINILSGAAEGINYLHEQGKVHRDVKSANVLLDEDLTPKIADCGLVRPGPADPTHSYNVTDVITGTRGYMPPEYYEGKVSVKMDAFAFGVVIFEVLTGLPNHDDKRENKYLKRHILETCDSPQDFLELLDPKCVIWEQELVFNLYEMARDLLNDNRKQRKQISEILPDLRHYAHTFQN